MTLSALIFRSSDPAGLLIWCVIGLCASIGFFFYGFQLLRRRRLILDTPFSKIRSASMGMVEVSGLAVGPYTMVAPITARPCYYFRTLVWEYRQNGKNKQWVKVAGECLHLPFFVDDNTGRVLVDPRGADLDLHLDFEQEFCDSFFTTKNPVPSNVQNFLSRHGIVTSNKIKVEEYCIKPKNSLFILGTLSENPVLEISPQPVQDNQAVSAITSRGFSLAINSFSFLTDAADVQSNIDSFQPIALHSEPRPQGLIRLSPESSPTKTSEMSQQQKISAALLKAGISNPAAWAAAGLPAAGVSLSGVQVLTDTVMTAPVGNNGSYEEAGSATQANAFDPHPPVVLMKGTSDKTFLISWRSQRQVARALGWKCTLMIWGGAALALFSLYLFLGIQHLR